MDITTLHKLFLKSNKISTDTRNIQKNSLFFALKGENFNGNQYATEAIEKGASYAIVDELFTEHPNCIVVNDVLKTLQDLAKFHRRHLNIPIIALTGSNGKTTTKELIYTVLSTKYNCVATKGNLNNHIGVPLTLLNMDQNTEIGVVEMGANHLKEIETLTHIALPNYGYITNIGKAHLEGFGSEENILLGKTELYAYLKQNKQTVFSNIDDKKLYQKSEGINTINFSKNKPNSIQINPKSTSTFVSVDFDNTTVNSQLIGNYNYTNIAASICIGKHFKIDSITIKNAIENYIPKNNRSELLQKKSNSIILDAYNANPSSMKAALENFKQTNIEQKSKITILGDMFELGNFSKKEHQTIAELTNDKTIDKSYLVGEHFSQCIIDSEKILLFKDTKSLLLQLKDDSLENSLILIKGSRGMKLEEVLPIFE